MTVQFRSSGDLTADRRYAYAVDLLQSGDAVAAGDLIEQALELAPEWPVGWFTLATAREQSGDLSAAAAAFGRAASLDPTDALGASLHLTRMGAAVTPDQPPAAYVRNLFDDYADRFDRALVDGLAYRAPQLIAAALMKLSGGQRFDHGLDLGCGTGLMAMELRPFVADLTGVDLSAGMIDAARSKALYDRLVVGDIIATMSASAHATYDLVTAADVFCYFGDLTFAISEAARLLRTGGWLAFTVESLPRTDVGDNFRLAESLRFRHTKDYIVRLLAEAKLTTVHLGCEILRQDRGFPVEGFVVVATK